MRYNKAWVALVMSILALLGAYGFIPETWVDETAVTVIISLLTPVLVYLIPNKE